MAQPSRAGGPDPPGTDYKAALLRRLTGSTAASEENENVTEAVMHKVDGGINTVTDLAVRQVRCKTQSLEKKRVDLVKLREQRQRFRLDLERIEREIQEGTRENAQTTADLNRAELGASEEHCGKNTNTGFDVAITPPARKQSISRLLSPVALGTTITDKPSSRSMPVSRRNSEAAGWSADDDDEVVLHRRSGKNRTRLSMPNVSFGSRDSNDSDNNASPGLGDSTTRFLFGDEETEATRKAPKKSEVEVNSYLQMNATEDKFPILVRRDAGVLSASSTALDLALSKPDSHTGPNRHRPAQKSLPANSFSRRIVDSEDDSSEAEHQKTGQSSKGTSAVRRVRFERRKTDFAYPGYSPSSADSPAGVPLQKLSPLFLQSTSNPNSSGTKQTSTSGETVETPTTTDAKKAPVTPEQRSAPEKVAEKTLSGSAVSQATNAPTSTNVAAVPNPECPPYYPFQYPQYGMPSLEHMAGYAAGFPFPTGEDVGQHSAFASSGAMTGMGNSYMQTRGNWPDSALPLISNDDVCRLNQLEIAQLEGQIYPLCKDQHGCRYLQRKLDERKPDTIRRIFIEVRDHVRDLMTDPFGNYLCQKLFEYTNDEQRTILVFNVALDLPRIALNQHGTRAVQKMIEFLSTREQILTVTRSLEHRVVELIQDINGNHVVQKCLNRLNCADAQFIFHAVGLNCVAVGTHRHGCCVLQRCIDHATGPQKTTLVSQVASNAFSLVRDPFGNYVVQYILDTGDYRLTEPLIRTFIGHVPQLSKQKFSSNVMEKCIRKSEPQLRDILIREILNPQELPRMLRDSFANYVVQTALDHAAPATKARLVDAIRPLLPTIRHTSYIRRIQSKVHAIDTQNMSMAQQTTAPDGMNYVTAPSVPTSAAATAPHFQFGGPQTAPFIPQSQYGMSMPTAEAIQSAAYALVSGQFSSGYMQHAPSPYRPGNMPYYPPQPQPYIPRPNGQFRPPAYGPRPVPHFNPGPFQAARNGGRRPAMRGNHAHSTTRGSPANQGNDSSRN